MKPLIKGSIRYRALAAVVRNPLAKPDEVRRAVGSTVANVRQALSRSGVTHNGQRYVFSERVVTLLNEAREIGRPVEPDGDYYANPNVAQRRGMPFKPLVRCRISDALACQAHRLRVG